MTVRERMSAREWRISGKVQGLGVRPAIARFAAQMQLTGRIFNTSSGVTAVLEGPIDRLDAFAAKVLQCLPCSMKVQRTDCSEVARVGYDDLRISQERFESSSAQSPLAAVVPQDVAICAACHSELMDAENRRSNYPLLTCAECGPRFSIVQEMPFERASTSMVAYRMCGACSIEYEDVADRRFHAQTIACHECGPRWWVSRSTGEDGVIGRRAIALIVESLRDGQIVALKGVGGYQLLCDATSAKAVARLRERKLRDEKPLAVMIADLEAAGRLGVLSPTDVEALCGNVNPIVLVPLRKSTEVADNVQAGLCDIGLMLPTTGVHVQVAQGFGRPLVCTSANLNGDPLVYEHADAVDRLAGTADLFVHHDRPVVRSVDDSVVRGMAGQMVQIRLGRGSAPLRLELPICEPILALGGHLKSAIALANGAQAILGPHIGDLDSSSTRQRFVDHVEDMLRLYRMEPILWLHDHHPDYFTTRWAQADGRASIGVPHHEAHIAAGILQHQLWRRPVLGFAWDGAGWGSDGMIWGGEVFAVTPVGTMERVARWRPFALPGGDLAAREPWRVALSLLHQCMEPRDVKRYADEWFPNQPTSALLSLIAREPANLKTTSVGRLFDGVAAICLGLSHARYEGHAAMLFESLANACDSGTYPISIVTHNKQTSATPTTEPRIEVDWRPMLQAIVIDRQQGVDIGTISTRFHRSLAEVVIRISTQFVDWPVVLGGGVFQNRLLTEMIAKNRLDTRIHLTSEIPPNDGGLAAGQLAWYAMRYGHVHD